MQSPVSTFVARTVVGPMLRRPWPILAAVCWCVASTAAAQSALTGIVHDPNGQLAVGATITVFDLPSLMPHPPTKTSAIGYYEIELPPGDYRIQAELDKLTFSGTARVLPNEKTAFDIDLNFYFNQEHVTVPADTLVSSTTMTSQAALGGTFTRAAIDTLPLSNGRTLQSLVSLVPGVVVTDSVGTLAQYTAVGQRRFANRMTVDGVSADLAIDARNQSIGESGGGTLPAFSTLGGTQTIVPLAAIEEIQVKTTNASPQDARAPGAQTIVVTRSGGNHFRGDAFADWRPQPLGASDWFANQGHALRGPASSQNEGASAGGPVVPERVFYFAAWEHQRVERPVRESLEVPSLASRDAAPDMLKPFLEAFPVPNGQDTTNGLAELSGDFPAVSNLSTFSLRMDVSLSASHRLFGRVNVGNSKGDSLDSLQVPTASFSNLEAARTTTATLGLSSTFSRLTNDLRANISTSRGWTTAGPSSHLTTGSLPLDLLLPPGSAESSLSANSNNLLNIVSTFGFGNNIQAGPRSENYQRQFQLTDVLALAGGRHDWRLGIDTRWATASTDPPNVYTYRFANAQELAQGRSRFMTILRALPARAVFTNVSAFAEDTFRVSKRFSLNYGVRYTVEPAVSSGNGTEPFLLDPTELDDPKALPTGTRLWNTSWGNIAPRVSATYQFGGASGHATTVRGGWGLAFDSLTSVGGAAYGGGYPYVSVRVVNGITLPVTESVWDAPVPSPLTPGDRNVYYAFPRDFRSPRTSSWQVGVDQALGQVQRLGIAYTGASGRDLPYWYVTNINGMTVNGFSNAGTSDYNALLAEYVWRLSHGLRVQLNYTWSHAIDLDSGERAAPNPPPSLIDPLSNRGSSDFDRRHVFETIASYELPRVGGSRLFHTLGSGWQIDAVVAYRSGAPLTVVSSRDIGYGTFAFRPDPVPGMPVWITDQSAPGGQRLNIDAFETADARAGTLGRNTLRSSPLRQVDLGLSRSIRLADRVVARLRIDAFNVFNIPSFGPPLAEMLNPTVFGLPNRSYATALGTGTLAGGGLVPLQQMGGPRSVQVSVRLAF
jgi:hypothetical protein